MDKQTLTFSLERETKNTVRYQEEPETGSPQIVGTLYVQKWVLGDPLPEKLQVTIEEG